MQNKFRITLAIALPLAALVAGGWAMSNITQPKATVDKRLAFILATPGLSIYDSSKPELHKKRIGKADKLPVVASVPFVTVVRTIPIHKLGEDPDQGGHTVALLNR